MGSYKHTRGTVNNDFNYEEHDEAKPYWSVFVSSLLVNRECDL